MLMAVTGLMLTGFVLAHLSGNLLDSLDKYSNAHGRPSCSWRPSLGCRALGCSEPLRCMCSWPRNSPQKTEQQGQSITHTRQPFKRPLPLDR
jgi:hypothetical protein